MAGKLYTVRHAQSRGNVDFQEYIKHGYERVPLSSLGNNQARDAAKAFAKHVLAEDIDNIVLISSPTIRAKETAGAFGTEFEKELISNRIGSRIVSHDATEIKFLSEDEQMTLDKAQAAGLNFGPDFEHDEYESYLQMRERASNLRSEIEKLLEEGKNIVVFSHSMMLKMLHSELLFETEEEKGEAVKKWREDHQPRNSQIQEFEFNDGKFTEGQMIHTQEALSFQI